MIRVTQITYWIQNAGLEARELWYCVMQKLKLGFANCCFLR